MATIKKRLNITLSKEVDSVLDRIAERDQTPKATTAAALLRVALETEEDQMWDAIADRRNVKDSRFVNHSKAWK